MGNKDKPIWVKAFIQHPCTGGSFDIMIEDTSGRPRFINIGYTQIQRPEEPKDDRGSIDTGEREALKFIVNVDLHFDRHRTFKDVIKVKNKHGFVIIKTINGETYMYEKTSILCVKICPQVEEEEKI